MDANETRSNEQAGTVEHPVIPQATDPVPPLPPSTIAPLSPADADAPGAAPDPKGNS